MTFLLLSQSYSSETEPGASGAPACGAWNRYRPVRSLEPAQDYMIDRSMVNGNTLSEQRRKQEEQNLD